MDSIHEQRRLSSPGAAPQALAWHGDYGGNILGVIDVGAEISGHTFAEGELYVLRGTEQNGESWTIARIGVSGQMPDINDLATVPFACRSLTFDGTTFWSNHRAANEVVSFSLP